jgi:predicted Zn finger-like uncharacterized protein
MAVIVCPTCSTRYRVADSQLSKASKLRCKKCNMVFQPQNSIAKDESSPDKGEPEIPTSLAESTQTFQGAGPQKLNIDLPFDQNQQVLPPHGAETIESRQGLPSNMNLGDMTIDFDMSPGTPIPEMDFSFSANIPENVDVGEAGEPGEGEAQEDQAGPGEVPGEPEATLTMDQGLDFSFNARIPGLEEVEPGGLPEVPEALTDVSDQPISLPSLELGATVPTEPPTAAPGIPPVEPAAGEQAQEEFLSTCCIDSLAMGLKKCEICGKNLVGKEKAVGEDLKQQRKQQLKGELQQGEVQVSFSEEQAGTEASFAPPTDEDFSDVERALDALADGSFEKVLKKKEVQKTRTQTMKMIGAGIGLLLLLVIGGIWLLLPSSHEKLVSRYKQLLSQKQVGSQEVTALFLDAASQKDQEVFNWVSVMPTIPDISGGTVTSVGEKEEEQSLGILGKDIQKLREDIATLEKTIEEKNKLLQGYMSKNLTPKLIEEEIKVLTEKQNALQQEFDGQVAESGKKLTRLRQDLANTELEIKENEKIAQKYMDATDRIGKALYQNSQTKKNLLAENKGKLEAQIRTEENDHQQRVKGIEAEYAPQFSTLKQRLQDQQALYQEAKLLQDREKSPVTLLSEELQRLTKTIADQKATLDEKQKQLKTAIAFFKRDDQKQRVTKDQNTATFVFVSKNVMASVKYRGGSKQKVPIVLKRYRATIGDQTIQSDWVVETILRQQ